MGACGSSTAGKPAARPEPVADSVPMGRPVAGYVPMGTVVAPVAAPGAAPPPAVRGDIARDFLAALRSEYVQHVGGAAGKFFDSGQPTSQEQRLLDPYEDQVRIAGNKAAAIAALEAQWRQLWAPPAAYSPLAEVRADVAQAFLAAVRSEYLQGAPSAVGSFFDSGRATAQEMRILEPYEDKLRESGNKEATIAALEAALSQAAAAQSAAAAPAQAPLAEIMSPEARLALLCQALGRPAGTPAHMAAAQGLQSPDFETCRMAVAVAATVGLGPPRPHADFIAAEARLRRERKLPADWDIVAYAGGRHLEGAMGGRQASAVVAFHPVGVDVVKEVQALFDSTYRKVYTRDRRGVPIPDKFVVREIHRVMNDQIWSEYDKRREQVRARLAGTRPSVPNGTETMNHLASARAHALPALDAAVNEVWLYHGTTREAATGIAENDFRLDLTGSNAGTLYGKGIYLAENCTKSDEYGEGPKGPAGDEAERGYEPPRPPAGAPIPPLVRESYIIICRSTLGKVHYTDQQRPDPDTLQQKCLSGEYDSVLGDRLKINGTFREIVVYHDDHVYPEYIVKYERVFYHEHFSEIYWAMLQRKKKRKFTGPLPAERDILTSMWNVYAMPNKGKINKWQLLDLLKSIKQPPKDEGEDLDVTFKEWDSKKDGWIDLDEFLQEVTQRVNDEIDQFGE